MFEKALRNKLRFNYKGSLSTEDLWDLSVEELDSIFKGLNQKAKIAKEESLLEVRSKDDDELALSIEIIKHIVEVKVQEAEVKKNAKAKKLQKEKLLSILASKQESDLQGKSTEELQKMIDELN
jgi:hypothetical protein